MRFRYPIIAIAIVLVFHALGTLGLYSLWHWYDMPMHFAGGMVMAMLAMAFWDAIIKNVTFTTRHPWARRVFFTFCIVGFVALVGIAWEWYEFVFDVCVLPALRGWGPAQPSIADTMADLFFDITGACTVSLFRRKV